jgi:hypothetical protein
MVGKNSRRAIGFGPGCCLAGAQPSSREDPVKALQVRTKRTIQSSVGPSPSFNRRPRCNAKAKTFDIKKFRKLWSDPGKLKEVVRCRSGIRYLA